MLHLSSVVLINVRNVVVPLIMLLASCDTDDSPNNIKWWKGHVAYHLDCLGVLNAMVAFFMTVASSNPMTSANGITWPKSNIAPHFDYLPNKYICAIGNAINITWCKCQNQMHHMTQKSHVTPHFDYVDQTGAVILLMIPLASHDADSGASGIMWQKKVMLHLILISVS